MDSSSQLYSSSTSKGMGETVNISRGFSMSSSSNSSRHRSKEMESLSLEISKYPRDLLQTFLGNNTNKNSGGRNRSDDSKLGEEEEDDEGLNLGLGLSLGGKFGVDKSKNLGGLIRSSSIAGTMPLFREDDTGVALPPTPGNNSNSNSNSNSNNNLVRTSSLPVETEEEWRKRKEMQTLRRMEAKRRRSEKQRVLKETGGVGGSGGSGGEEKGVEGLKLRARLEREQQCLGLTSKLIGSSMGNFFGSSKPPPPSNNLEVKGRRTTFGSLQGFLIAQDQAQAQAQAQAQVQVQPQQGSSQGSGESQGGTSSDASELESKTHQGSSSCGDTRSPPSSTHSLPDRDSQETMGPSGIKDNPFHRASRPEPESSSKQPESTDNKKKETASGGIEDMPCVFTIGDGPNGRKVEGILYKYGKGEEVRIMCVCHGTFHSPKEFVKHAGGKDVEHPLRHIVVSPSTSPFQ